MRPRVIVGFFVRFVIVYGALMALWPVAADEYHALFRAGGNMIFGSFGSTRTVPFRMCSRHVGYLPTAALAGLVVATPIPWSRRSRALLWGLLSVHGFIALRLGIAAVYVWTFRGPAPLVQLDLFWKKALDVGVNSISVGQTVSYIAPIVIWALVSFRREDLAMIIPRQRHRKT